MRYGKISELGDLEVTGTLYASGALTGSGGGYFSGGTYTFGGDTIELTGSFLMSGTATFDGGPYEFNASIIEIIGSLAVVGGLSGSLQCLADGKPYLIAGPNITVNTNSLGQVEVTGSAGGGGGDSYFVSSYSGTLGYLYTTGSVAFSGGDDEWTFNTVTKGADVFFYVSGTISGSEGTERKAVFGGDMVASGSLGQGNLVNPIGAWSHAEGSGTLAYGIGSHAEGGLLGYFDGSGPLEEGGFGGSWVGPGPGPTFIPAAQGDYSHVEGVNTRANGSGSHAEGIVTLASGAYSHAEGISTIASGAYSHAEGDSTIAIGVGSHVEGKTSLAYWDYAHAEGDSTIAIGYASHAEGASTLAGAKYAVSDASGMLTGVITLSKNGDYTTVYSGRNLIIFDPNNGYQNITADNVSYDSIADLTSISSSFYSWVSIPGPVYVVDYYDSTRGIENDALGLNSHAAGIGTRTLGNASYAEGNVNYALGDCSHTEGLYNFSFGIGSHAEGQYNYTAGVAAHAEGIGNIALGAASHAEGIGNISSRGVAGSRRFEATVVNGEVVLDSKYGDVSTFMPAGDVIIADSNGKTYLLQPSLTPATFDGTNSKFPLSDPITIDGTAFVTDLQNFARPIADDVTYSSHTEGYSNNAFGTAAHAEGVSNNATAKASHAEGELNIAQGIAAHAEGRQSIAWGDGSHVEGYNNLSFGSGSHAEGKETRAGAGANFGVLGAYDGIITFNASNPGNWTDTVVDGLYSVGDQVLVVADSKVYSDTITALSYNPGTDLTSITGSTSAAYSGLSVSVVNASSIDKARRGTGSLGAFTHVEGSGSWALADGASASGFKNIVASMYSHVEGISNVIYGGSGSHAEGYNNQVSGAYSHVEGRNTFAGYYSGLSRTPYLLGYSAGPASTPKGEASHAEGYGTYAVGYGSHAEGMNSVAFGNYSHAEGYAAWAQGAASHAAGAYAAAFGNYSYAGGFGTLASGSSQTVVGKFNKQGNNFSLFVVGNGSDEPDGNRSDIFRVNTANIEVSGSVNVSGSYILNVVSGTASPNYNVSLADHVIVFNKNNVTGVLNPAAPVGSQVYFKDGTGAATTLGGQEISSSSGRIDGASTAKLQSTNYSSLTVVKISASPEEWIIL